jgi:hypothetical protein
MPVHLAGRSLNCGDHGVWRIEMDQPRFVIINDCDEPIRENIAEFVPEVGYCYMAREEKPQLKVYDGMKLRQLTSVEDFGFLITVRESVAEFSMVGQSRATYPDGKPRKWQDRCSGDEFSLPLVKRFKR